MPGRAAFPEDKPCVMGHNPALRSLVNEEPIYRELLPVTNNPNFFLSMLFEIWSQRTKANSVEFRLPTSYYTLFET